MNPNANVLSLKLNGLCCIIAPVLFGVSTFFWRDNEYGVTAATLIALSMIFYIPALSAVFGLVKNKMPYYYVLGRLLAIYGCCLGGIGFALLGYFAAIFHISHQTYLQTLAQYPLSSGLLIFWAGPVFPLSLLALGVNLVRKKAVPAWAGILICLGGVLFPFGRILRLELLGHVTDLLIAVPFVVTGLSFINRAETYN